MSSVQNSLNQNSLELAAVSVCFTYVVFAGKSRIIKSIFVGSNDKGRMGIAAAALCGFISAQSSEGRPGKEDNMKRVADKCIVVFCSTFISAFILKRLSKQVTIPIGDVMRFNLANTVVILSACKVTEIYECVKLDVPAPIKCNRGDVVCDKDRATLALAAGLLRWKGIPIPEGVEAIRTWFNDKNNRTVIQGVKNLYLLHGDLKVLPVELSLLTGLQYLNLCNNQLKSIDVSGFTQLKELNLCNNQLKSIDVSGFTQLKKLNLCNNQLKSIDVSGFTQLKELWLEGNPLESIDVSGLTGLRELWLRDNRLTSVEGLSGLTKLLFLHLSRNHLTSIDVSGLTDLMLLDLSSNPLESIDVSVIPRLKWLYLKDNLLSKDKVKKSSPQTQLLL